MFTFTYDVLSTEEGITRTMMLTENSPVRASKRQCEDLHVVGHSQGGVLLTEALEELYSRGIRGWTKLRVENHGSAAFGPFARRATERLGGKWVGSKGHPLDPVYTTIGLSKPWLAPLLPILIPTTFIPADVPIIGSKHTSSGAP